MKIRNRNFKVFFEGGIYINVIKIILKLYIISSSSTVVVTGFERKVMCACTGNVILPEKCKKKYSEITRKLPIAIIYLKTSQ